MIFFDFEVFKQDWLVVFINPVEKKETVIVNDSNKLKEFYKENKEKIFLGYNARSYDQYIFKAILCGFNPKEVSDFIIEKNKAGWMFSNLLNKIYLNFYDVMLNPSYSLKTLEGFMGHNIKESSVPFNINRKLTANEIAEVIEYCRNDVKETIDVFVKQKEDFLSHKSLINMFNLHISNIKKTKAQLSAFILGAKKIQRNDEFNITILNNIQLNKYKHILNWYKDKSNMNYNKSLEVNVAGVPHIFGWGGLHGAIKNYREKGNFINVDVASYYPSLMIEYDFQSRNIPNKEKFKNIYNQRLEYKKVKDKRQQPLKIVLNSTYGAMKDVYNDLYDPLQANNVCINGQLFLLDLIEKLEPFCKIIQSNTDGILIKVDGNENKVLSICKEWEDRTKMKLEYDKYTEVIQKDVNNYIIVDKDGNYKSKGAFVKKLNDLDYNLPIVNKAVVDYLIKGVKPETTINNCNELKEFQQIIKITSNYEYAVQGCKKLNEKTLRVFASISLTDYGVYKVKNGKQEKFADTPLNVFIVNENVNNMKCPIKLDRQYYINLANKRINQFLGK